MRLLSPSKTLPGHVPAFSLFSDAVNSIHQEVDKDQGGYIEWHGPNPNAEVLCHLTWNPAREVLLRIKDVCFLRFVRLYHHKPVKNWTRRSTEARELPNFLKRKLKTFLLCAKRIHQGTFPHDVMDMLLERIVAAEPQYFAQHWWSEEQKRQMWIDHQGTELQEPLRVKGGDVWFQFIMGDNRVYMTWTVEWEIK